MTLRAPSLREIARTTIWRRAAGLAPAREDARSGRRRGLAPGLTRGFALALAAAGCGKAESPTPAASPTPAEVSTAPADARIADLPIDAELARRLAGLADRIDREPHAWALLLQDEGLTLEGYVERLQVIALDARLAAVYSDTRDPAPDVAAMAHVLGDEDG